MTIDLSRILRQLPALAPSQLLALQAALAAEIERRAGKAEPERLYSQAEMDAKDNMIRGLVITHNEQVAIIRDKERIAHWQELANQAFEREQANKLEAMIVRNGVIDATGYKP